MKLVAALLTILLLAVPSQARVLVYKGTAKIITLVPPVTSVSTVRNLYFLVDPDTNQYSSVTYYTKNGKHLAVASPSPLYLASAAALAGKTKTAMTFGNSTFTDTTHFSAALILLSGTNATLQVKTTGGAQTINFPKTFAGPQSFVSNVGGNGNIFQTQFLLSFQSKLTLAANDAGNDIAAVTSQISQDLQNKGYLP